MDDEFSEQVPKEERVYALGPFMMRCSQGHEHQGSRAILNLLQIIYYFIMVIGPISKTTAYTNNKRPQPFHMPPNHATCFHSIKIEI